MTKINKSVEVESRIAGQIVNLLREVLVANFGVDAGEITEFDNLDVVEKLVIAKQFEARHPGLMR